MGIAIGINQNDDTSGARIIANVTAITMIGCSNFI